MNKFLLAIFVATSFAGTPSGVPAFFVESAANWNGALESKTYSWAGHSGYWHAETRALGQSFELSMYSMQSSAEASLFDREDAWSRTVTMESRNSSFMASYGLFDSSLSLQGRLGLGTTSLYSELLLGWRSSHNSLMFRGFRNRQKPFYFSWSDTLFPTSTPVVAGDYSSDRWGADLLGEFDLSLVNVGASLALYGSSPRQVQSHYGLRDSSLWLEGRLALNTRLPIMNINFQTSSLSGRCEFFAWRKSAELAQRVAQARTTWDFSDGWLSITSATSSHTLLHRTHPLNRLAMPTMEPPLDKPSFKIGLEFIRARLFEPQGDDRIGSFSANRLFDPDLTSILGFAFYRKTVFAQANAKIWAFHAQGFLPYWGRHFGIWLGLGLSHYLASAAYHGEIVTSGLVLRSTESYEAKVNLDAFMATGQAGFSLRDHPFGHWRLSFFCEQLAPIAPHLWRNGQDYFAKNANSPKPSSLTEFDPLRDGFQAYMRMEYSL